MANQVVVHEGRLAAHTNLGATELLSFAAAPTFALMALLNALPGGGPLEALCSGGHDASPLTGMAAMYVLMSAFHSAPWLKLMSRRRSDAHRP
jgi:hypothetical protein